jgi:hypothetical protein
VSDPFDELDALTLQFIGDEISYLPGGAQPGIPIKGWVDHAPPVMDIGSTSAITAQAAAQLSKADVPKVAESDRFYLPRTGLLYRAVEPTHSKCGRLWDVMLVKVKQ